MILIITEEGDLHGLAVAWEIAQLGAATRVLDLSHFPARARLTIEYDGGSPRIAYIDDGEPIDLRQVGAVWWRRPQPFGFEEGLDGWGRYFAANECREAIEGLWQILDAEWVNDPQRDDRAQRKVLQLKMAVEVGLSIPETLITNDPDQARSFLAWGANIYKPFSATAEAWRETRMAGAAELEQIDLLRHAPIIFQRYVEGVDVRVTAVGDTLFAAEIDVREARYSVDFRMSMDEALIAPCMLPGQVADSIKSLMRRLGLVYGALDFRRRPDGSFVFLEINPAGQWLFVEEPTGLPIAQRLASMLVELDRGSMRGSFAGTLNVASNVKRCAEGEARQ